jgi:hypothetical protein
MMSESSGASVVGRSTGRPGGVAAIYARVSSDRQRREQTIASQTAALRELAAGRGLLVSEDLVFEDEGVSGAVLRRPALERLRDLAVEGRFEVLAVSRTGPARAPLRVSGAVAGGVRAGGDRGGLREGARAVRHPGG